MMLLKWFNTREATKAATALADQFPRLPGAASVPPGKREGVLSAHAEALGDFLRRAAHESRTLQLNLFKKAWFANAFKWRLLEQGVDAETASEWTQTLVVQISANQTDSELSRTPAAARTDDRTSSGKRRNLSALAREAHARGDYAQAATHFQALVGLKPHPEALNDLGAVLFKLGRYEEAELHLRKAIGREPNLAVAHANLGAVHLRRGHLLEAANCLRRALKLKPNRVDPRANLGLTLVYLGRLVDAKAQFEKVLKIAPRHAQALHGMGVVARAEGRFDEAQAFFDRALEVDPNMPAAWAALAGIRKMVPADRAWLERAQEIAAGGLAPAEEATVRFAIGKYCDDVEQFAQAFTSYKRANELLKTIAAKYDPDARTRLVDDLIRVYTRDSVSRVDGDGGGSDSIKPIFVVGMMRSGTSLAEQIIASHPAVRGAGELPFWSDAVREHEALVRREPLGEPTRKELAERYLRVLTGHSPDAGRIVDKAPINSDYLGVIHSVFPNARIIYMRRDPIDTCLSCYFQQFPPTLSFTMDLSDLAHYYREHQRLMAHWRAVLPPGSILDVPYEALVSDQEGWTRRILDFLGLDWDERCLNFHRTERTVVTASYWQVRQRIYKDSVRRWHNYTKFLGPLLELKDC